MKTAFEEAKAYYKKKKSKFQKMDSKQVSDKIAEHLQKKGHYEGCALDEISMDIHQELPRIVSNIPYGYGE